MTELKREIVWKNETRTKETFDNESEFLYRVTTLKEQGYVEGIENGDFYISTSW